MQYSSEFSLYDYLHTIRKRIFIIIETVVLIVIIVMTASSFKKKTFNSSASVLVERTPVIIGSTLPYGYMQAFTNYMELIKSNLIVDEAVRIVDKLMSVKQTGDIQAFAKLYTELLPYHSESIKTNFDNEIIQVFNSFDFNIIENYGALIKPSITATQVGTTDIIRIGATDTERNRVLNFLRALMDTFVKQSKNIMLEEKIKRREFIESQIKTMEATLSSCEQSIKEFQQNEQIFTIEGEISRQQELITELETDYAKTKIEYEKQKLVADTLLTKLEKDDFTKISFSEKSSSDTITGYKTQLVDLQGNLAALMVKYKDSHPEVKALKLQIESLKKTIERELSISLSSSELSSNPIKEQVVENLVATKVAMVESESKLDALQKIIDSKQESFKNLPEKNYEYIKLTRKMKVTENIYSQLLQKFNEVQIEEASARSEIKIVDFPSVNFSPVGSRYLVNLTMSIISGLITGLALAFLIEHLDRTIKTPEETKYITNKKILATIPIMKPAEKPVDSLYSPLLSTIFESNSLATEQFRVLRTNLQFYGRQKNSSMYVITSSHPQEGKTLITSNLAITIAQSGKKTLLVDTDLRRPNIHKIFGFDNTKGLTDLISGKSLEQCLNKTDVENLDILCTGAIIPSPTEYINSNEFAELIKEFKSKYDCVLFDSPPVLPVTDTLLLSAHVGEVLFLVNIRESNSQSVKKCFEMFNNIRVNISGVICNKVNIKNISGYYYKY